MNSFISGSIVAIVVAGVILLISKPKSRLITIDLIKGYLPFLIIIYIIIIGLGPIRRVLKPIIPDILENKASINSICDGMSKVYVVTSDNGSVATQVVSGGCIPSPGQNK